MSTVRLFVLVSDFLTTKFLTADAQRVKPATGTVAALMARGLPSLI